MIAIFAIAAALLTALLLLWRLQERILFQPPPLMDGAPEAGRVVYEALDGQRLMGYMIGDAKAARGVLLCFHGNADLSVWQIEWARLVQRHSEFAVFLAEYRGYMSLGGVPTYQTTKLDARAAYDYLRISVGVERSRLVFFGHSLGSAIATELAGVHPPAALILQSPFTSARAMARLIATPAVTLVWRAISRIHFDTPRIVAELDVPVSVAHGRRDRIVPFRMGLEVHQAARNKGELLIVDRAGHNDVAEVAGAEYWRWLAGCLQQAPRTTVA
jgi:fermentation-respiration switch protein FrsA (DUF1100 family)